VHSTVILRRAVALALVLGLFAVPVGTPGGSAGLGVSRAVAHPAPDGFADLAEKLLPSVVNISTTQTVKTTAQSGDKDNPDTPDAPQFPPGSPFEQFFKDFLEHQHQGHGQSEPQAETRKATSLGSGFIVDPSGYVVTNNHVINDADEITVILHDNTNLKAELVGRDTKTDIAVLKVKADKPLTAVPWGDSDKSRVGDWVLAIGNPFGLGGTVTAGILSARQRDINSGPYDDFLQTDASINKGNSGGPMFNMDGQVIGINTAIYSPSGGSIGIGFAIPSTLAQEVVHELIAESDHTVHRGWLGVRIQEVTDDVADSLGLSKPQGALVASVTENGPAQAAGIQPGDVILTFNGKDVTEMRNLPRLVAETPVDKTVPLTVWRKRAQMNLSVKIGRLQETETASAETSDKPKPASPQADTAKALGMTLSDLTPDLKEKYSLGDDAKGIVVVDVAKDSASAEKGLRAGDVIMEASQEEVKTPGQLVGKVADAKKLGRKSILLLIQRQGDLRFVALRIDQG
jgi:serine protease Do